MKSQIAKHWGDKKYNSPLLQEKDPAKVYKEDTSKFKDFESKSDTLVKGNSRDLSTANKIVNFNSRNFSGSYKNEKTFQEPNGTFSTMRVYAKSNIKK
jgi:hypothetical protein